MRRRPWIPLVVLAGALIAIQIAASSLQRDVLLDPLVRAAYFSVVVMGLCLVMGHAGQISLGHGAFVAVGGYTSAILTTTAIPEAGNAGWGAILKTLGVLSVRQDLYGSPVITVSPLAAFVAGLLLAAGIAALIGWPALRLKGHYLAMATLGFGLIIYRLVLGTEFMGAADGIAGVPPWSLGFGLIVSGRKAFRVVNYYIAWSFAILVLIGLLNIVRSRVGRALQSIHGGELAANAMGINTAAHKLQAFVLSAVLAAAAGSLLTHYNGYIGPSKSGAMESVRYVALVAAGGMGNLWGVLIVSTILNFLSLRGCFGTLDQAVFGALLIAIVSFAPEGPLQPIAAWARSFFTRKAGGKQDQRGNHVSA